MGSLLEHIPVEHLGVKQRVRFVKWLKAEGWPGYKKRQVYFAWCEWSNAKPIYKEVEEVEKSFT